MPSQVLIMRGLPGSGKSYAARKFYQHTVPDYSEYVGLCSTDDYFYQEGIYRFDPTRLEDNHRQNQQRFAELIARQWPLVVCDNTNMQQWELESYIEVAREQGCEILVVEVGDPQDMHHQKLCAERNRHGINDRTIFEMASNYEPIDSWLSTLNIPLVRRESWSGSIT